MAKAKKKASKPSKKSAPSKAARRKGPPARLSTSEKLGKLKPGDDLNELIADILSAWSLVSRKVRVGDVTRAQLGSLARKAEKASARESALASKQAAKLAPLTDARLVANDAAYRAALKIKRIADAVAETDQAVADAFATVSERFRRMAPPAKAPDAPA